MHEALAEIRGHRSAHSLETGPEIPDPCFYCCNEVCERNKVFCFVNISYLHFSLWVNNNSSVVLEVDESTILSSPMLSLSDDNSLKNLLSQLWLTSLDGGHNHVSSAGSWKSVQSSLNTLHRDDVQVLGSSVVGAVHDSRHWERQ